MQNILPFPWADPARVDFLRRSVPTASRIWQILEEDAFFNQRMRPVWEKRRALFHEGITGPESDSIIKSTFPWAYR